MAIVVVNPNPVFDRTILLERLVPGTVMRTLDVEVTAGGKGINVARALRALGVASTLVIPVGSDDHQRYAHLIADEGADAEFFDVSGFVRIASIYRERDSDQVSVVNDAGYRLPESEWDAFVQFAAGRVEPGDVALVMGSLPAGLPRDAATSLVSAIRERDASVLLDTAPSWLAPAMAARPDVIAPNVHEAQAALTGEASTVFDDAAMTPEQAQAAAVELAARCAAVTGRLACVTAGAAGVAYAHADSDANGFIQAPVVQAVSAVGAGDSFVAGLASRWNRDRQSGHEIDWHAAVGFGVACAAASCEVVRAGGVEPHRAAELAAELGIADFNVAGAR